MVMMTINSHINRRLALLMYGPSNILLTCCEMLLRSNKKYVMLCVSLCSTELQINPALRSCLLCFLNLTLRLSGSRESAKESHADGRRYHCHIRDLLGHE